MSFDTYYDDVPASQRDALRQFRQQHPPRTVTAPDGTNWTYYTTGDGGQVLLWLVGGLKRADAAYRSIPLLSDTFKIVAPDYPAVSSMQALADGLHAILEQEAAQSAHILAGSFGGMLAQVFARAYPHRVDRIILSTTSAPDASAAENFRQQRAFIEPLPEETIQTGAKMQMYTTIAPPDEESAFYRAYLDELYSERLNKNDIMTMYDCIIDYMANADFSPDDLSDGGASMLILGSADDQTFDRGAFERLTQLYPKAQTHLFENGGHSPASTQRDAYFARVREFLSG